MNEFHLREIPEAIRALIDEYNSEDATDERRIKIEASLEELEGDFAELLEHLCTSIGEYEANGELFSDEVKRLQEKKVRMALRAERTRSYIDNLLKRRKVAKIQAGLYNLSYRKSKAVEITDFEKLPASYVRIKREADKIEIKKALEGGSFVPGAFIVEHQNLQIK